ncbi:MAG: hypothetical protein P0119_16420 [Nitrospira sp.]|nr:hypothetical protein [Nitrospira sp.]
MDRKKPHPDHVAAEPMLLPRLHLNAVLLPNRTVFVTGGSLKQEDKPLARLQAETYDPATGQWRLMATFTIPRPYHSTALLLPDGRVVTAGGNPEACKCRCPATGISHRLGGTGSSSSIGSAFLPWRRGCI